MASQEKERNPARDALRLGLVEHVPSTNGVAYCNNNLTYARIENGNCSSCGRVVPSGSTSTGEAPAAGRVNRYEVIYRCDSEWGDCSWSTRSYSEIDAHEELVGHSVTGQQERILPDGSREIR